LQSKLIYFILVYVRQNGRIVSKVNFKYGAPIIVAIGTVMAGLVMYKTTKEPINDPKLTSALKADIPDK